MMNLMKNSSLVVLAVCFHLLFLYGIFDIYFTSPLVHGMTPYSSTIKSPAKRLVLFVADGLRADKFFELDENSANRGPYLRSIIEERGVWGVSHTRVPTESRPGHVALIAGFYEDVSAVAKGWKENPVEFDSLFNESRHTWSWGSPDILPMFAKGSSGDHVRTFMYPAESEDFAGANSSLLDTWVFDQVQSFLGEARRNDTLSRTLHEDRTVMFLHLLGIDTNGHAHRPYSREYLDNIGVVDAGVKKIEGLIEDFYERDGRTAYVFSADHGMTDWGSHGAGHPHETLTPLVAWGAGVRTPRPSSPGPASPQHNQREWGLDHLARCDVNQADVAALMAALIGIPYPLNSVGVLPVCALGVGEEQQADMLAANARQILAQFEVKMRQKKDTTLSSFFRPYKELTPSIQASLTREMSRQMSEGQYQAAMSTAHNLIERSLKGLHYYHSYDRVYLGACVTVAFGVWLVYIFAVLVEGKSDRGGALGDKRAGLFTFSTLLWTSAAVACFLLWIQSLPLTHYVYILFPLFNLRLLANRLGSVREAVKSSGGSEMHLLLSLLVVVCGLEIMVLGFFHRGVVSLGLLLLALINLLSFRQAGSSTEVKVVWVGSLLLLAIFPLLPPVGRDHNYTVVYAAAAICIAGSLIVRNKFLKVFRSSEYAKKQGHWITILQLVLVGVAACVVFLTQMSIQEKRGLPVFCQVLSWLLLLVSWLPPLFTDTAVPDRLFSVTLAVVPPYILLSTAHEALFILSLVIVLCSWLSLENRRAFQAADAPVYPTLLQLRSIRFSSQLPPDSKYPTVSDLRAAFSYLYLTMTAFFGTGNIASINTFDPASVYCFLTVFNPFVMAALMLTKILIPFLLVGVFFCGVQRVLCVSARRLALLTLLMSDVMALNFFFLIQDTGSWLEIGTSISHFVIAVSVVIVTRLILVLATTLTSACLISGSRRKAL